MNFFEELEKGHYGSIELRRVVGPNLLKGLAISVLVHVFAIGIPLLLNQMRPEPDVAAAVKVRVVELSQLAKIAPLPETPKPIKIPKPKFRGPRGGNAAAPPGYSPVEVEDELTSLAVLQPSNVDPRYGLTYPLLSEPLPTLPSARLDPNASSLPDIHTVQSDKGDYYPPAALPAPVSSPGGVYRGAGSADLPTSNLSTYTGPKLGVPSSDIPSAPISHGNVNSTAKVPGTGTGERFVGQGGTGSGGGGSGTGGGLTVEDLIPEEELSGLLAWLRGQRSTFPPVVQTFMQTHPTDLCGITSHEGWDIFIQFSPDVHQLKIFLSQSGSGILLADSDFRSRSQMFGLGHVIRSSGEISAIEASREKPTLERTNEFYRVFQDWMHAHDILMGSREAK